jgi:hypothetical protein
MSVPAQGGLFGFALQAAKIGRGGTFTVGDYTWYKVRAPRVSIGAIQDQQVFPPEVGGIIVPTGAYKQAKFFAGDVDLIPRLEESIGVLLAATMGNVSSVSGEDADGEAVTNLYTHIFNFDPTSSYELPWMAVRRTVPGAEAADTHGEVGYDCKVANLRLTVPQMGKVAARFTMIGRDFLFENNPTWTWTNADFEAHDSTPDVGRGSFKIGGVEYPLTGAVIDMVNGLTTPRDEMIIGDFSPDDFVPLTRAMTIRIVYKWEDAELFRKIYTGTANGTTWSSLPFEVDTGGNAAFEAVFEAPANVPTTSPASPYRLRVRANKVTWAPDGPVELRGGTIVQQQFIGTVLEPEGSLDYADIVVENGYAGTNYS